MSDKLVTLAIRTYQRAQMIKAVLEEHGIETIIHNLNLEHPEMAVGVRVRIKEKDLPQALAIVEQIEKEWEKENGEEKREKPPVLIPIDFSDQVAKSIDFGFEFARKHGTSVMFLYVYYTPMFTISSNNNEVSTYSISDGELLRRIVTALRYSRLYLNPDRNLAATPRIFARATSSPNSASVMSMRRTHHSAC